jgi:hypothetical protein
VRYAPSWRPSTCPPTTVFAVVVQLPVRVALGAGFAVQLAVHFTLQRTFVWWSDHRFALRSRHQAQRYLAVAAGQLGVTAMRTSLQWSGYPGGRLPHHGGRTDGRQLPALPQRGVPSRHGRGHKPAGRRHRRPPAGGVARRRCWPELGTASGE